jgi:D-sedoheptulose 7-phosphate isomerase
LSLKNEQPILPTKMKIKSIIDEHIAVAKSLKDLSAQIEQISQVCKNALANGNKILLAGNGGSAADAQHIAAEFVGRYVKHRKSLPALALTTDTSALTAISNDYGFEYVFARQLEGLGNKGDVFIGISTSGNSANIIRCVQTAKEIGITTIGLLGRDGGVLKNQLDFNIVINSDITARIQEMHILIGHIICEWVETED